MRLLIADDEIEIAKVLRAVLEHNNYSVDTVSNGTDALDYALSGSYDGIILDIMMPGKDGLTVLRQMRAGGVTTPVMLLTAKSELQDRIKGLDAGADDYLPKPFAITELLARVRALLRRSDSYTPDILDMGNVSLNCSTYELSTGEEKIRLNNKEFQMMETFMRNPERVFSSDELMEKIWGWDSKAEINVVWTNVACLRKKLAGLNATAEICSVRGAGYCLTERKTA